MHFCGSDRERAESGCRLQPRGVDNRASGVVGSTAITIKGVSTHRKADLGFYSASRRSGCGATTGSQYSRCHAVRSSFCRSTQCAPASPDLTASATILRSNPNSIEQTASDEADASQSGVPPSASPATTDLSEAIAAELIEPTTFGVGSTFSQSTILTEGVDEGTLTNKTSQFKSSGATSTVNSTDAGSSKNLSAPPSSTNDHSAQAGSVSFQHVQGDSSTAAPLAIKSLESIATQTIPVSNHTAPVSPSLPHTASSTTDGLIKAQDSADAASGTVGTSWFHCSRGHQHRPADSKHERIGDAHRDAFGRIRRHLNPHFGFTAAVDGADQCRSQRAGKRDICPFALARRASLEAILACMHRSN